jgi:rfaE bifunctional protein nucleotidyltransferase chain/domain
LKKLSDTQKKVLVGGCFDVLHKGHIIFLQKAKLQGDSLVVLLESDEKIKRIKGDYRPVNNQKKRAKALSDLGFVDTIILLSDISKGYEYDKIIKEIKPSIIAVTKGTDSSFHKRSAKKVGAKVLVVTDLIGDYSSTKIISSL